MQGFFDEVFCFHHLGTMIFGQPATFLRYLVFHALMSLEVRCIVFCNEVLCFEPTFGGLLLGLLQHAIKAGGRAVE